MKRISHKIGLRPGTLVHVGRARTERTDIRVFVYDAQTLTETANAVAGSIPELRKKGHLAWIHVTGLQDINVLKTLAEQFGIHDLMMEDIANTGLRPKFEEADNHLFAAFKRLEYDPDKLAVTSDQISVVWGSDFVLSFVEVTSGAFEPVRERIRKTIPRIRLLDPDYLAYALMDVVVDHYFLALERLGDQLETYDEGMLENPEPERLQDIFEVKQQLLKMRKGVWPLREAIGALERSDSKLLHKATRPYLRDLYDHVIQAADTVETYRDMTSSLQDLYLNSVSNKMNSVMKVLTIIATIFIPLSFLAGIYGMNFDPAAGPLNMPELSSPYGYVFFWALVIVIGGGLLALFRRKGWL